MRELRLTNAQFEAWQVIDKAARQRRSAQAYEKNQLGLGQMFLNSLRLTWCMALLADAVVLLRARALLHASAREPALLRELAPQQAQLNFDTAMR